MTIDKFKIRTYQWSLVAYPTVSGRGYLHSLFSYFIILFSLTLRLCGSSLTKKSGSIPKELSKYLSLIPLSVKKTINVITIISSL